MSDLQKRELPKEKVCPILARGWLSNECATRTDIEETFSFERLPKCLREDCEAWGPKKGIREEGCRLMNSLR